MAGPSVGYLELARVLVTHRSAGCAYIAINTTDKYIVINTMDMPGLASSFSQRQSKYNVQLVLRVVRAGHISLAANTTGLFRARPPFSYTAAFFAHRAAMLRASGLASLLGAWFRHLHA